MKFGVVFLSGVHGVGKGFVSERLSNDLSLPVFSASSLIRQKKNAPVDHGKVVVDADKNQDHLIDALSNLSIQESAIILDGHFCLSSSAGIIHIPIYTFRSMPMKAVVLITAEPEVIHQRLMTRDGAAMAIDDIAVLQNHEIDHAKRVTDILDVPLLVVGQDELKYVSDWIAASLALE
jgi:adenylate kinase